MLGKGSGSGGDRKGAAFKSLQEQRLKEKAKKNKETEVLNKEKQI